MPPAPTGPQPKNGLGTTSLVMGILSLVGAWIPFVGFGAYITSILGIVTGALGRGRAKRGLATNGGAAMGGLVTSVLGLASVILATVVYSSVMYAVATTDPSDLPTSVPSKSATKDDTKPAAGIGDTVEDGDFAFTVTDVTTASTIGGALGEDAQGRFVIVHVTVKNNGNAAEMFDASNQTLFDGKGREFTTAEAQLSLESDAFLQDVNPGNSVKGKLVFDMPKNAVADHIELHAGLLGVSEGATVSLR